jgi:hypothetical protein
MTRTMRRAPGPCASETTFIMQVGGRFVNGPAAWSGDREQEDSVTFACLLERNFLKIADKIAYAMEQGITLPSLHPGKCLEKCGRCQE